MRIIAETNEREISATQFHTEFGGPVEGIRRRFKLLEKAGWLKKIDQKTGGRRRGAAEKFYRATGPVIPDDEGPWANVPDLLGDTDGWRIFEQLSTRIKEAMKAGTFDSREDRYLAWSLVRLDQQGWEKVASAIQALRAVVLEEEKSAIARMDKSGEKPITVTVGLGVFESSMSPREP